MLTEPRLSLEIAIVVERQAESWRRLDGHEKIDLQNLDSRAPRRGCVVADTVELAVRAGW